MSFIPLHLTLEVYTAGEPVKDRFNNMRPGPGTWREIKVASWWVDSVEETTAAGDSILRTIDTLTIHIPPESAPKPDGKIRLPDGTIWQVEGHPEDYNHGWHGFAPGLVAINAKKVEG